MGYVFFVRSPYAHAHITSIDVSKAEAIKGVHGTLTGEEVAALTDPFFQLSTPPGAHLKDYALAVGKVRYVGEAVVAVVAETRELARDASELVEVDYEPLAPVTDARNARGRTAPVLHEDSGSNLMWEGVYEWGDLDAAFAEADRSRQDQRAPLPPLQLDAARDATAPSSSSTAAPGSGRSTRTTSSRASPRS